MRIFTIRWKVATTFAFAVAVLPAAEVMVPDSIPKGLEQDVSGELNAFLEAVPSGSTVIFPAGAVYRIEGTVLLKGKSDLVIDGGGSTFRATDSMPDVAKAENHGKWRETRNRAHWRIQDCGNVTMKNMRIIGAHPNGGKNGEYDANREAQHGIDISGAKKLLIEAVHISDVWGDGCYISNHSHGVTIRDSKIERTGRQGIAVAVARDIQIENNDIGDSRRGLIDIEPYGKDWASGDIRIIGNRFGSSRLLVFPMGGGGSIGAVLIANNVLSGQNGVPVVYHQTKNPDVKRGPFFFVGNRVAVGGSPAAALRFGDVEGVLVAGNRMTFPEKRKMSAIRSGARKAAVFGNVFAGAAGVLEGGGEPLFASDNLLAEGGEFETEVMKIPGGHAVRVRAEGRRMAVGLMAGGTNLADRATLSAFGIRTEAAWAWAVIEDGEIVESGTEEGGTVVAEEGD